AHARLRGARDVGDAAFRRAGHQPAVRCTTQPAAPQTDRIRLPALLSPADADRARKRRAPAVGGRRSEAGATETCGGTARIRRTRGTRRPPTVATVRRRDAACGD